MKADHLRFRAPPRSDIRFSGTPGRKSAVDSSRTNLPDPVSEGVDYHDVRVTHTIVNRLRSTAAQETTTHRSATRKTTGQKAVTPEEEG